MPAVFCGIVVVGSACSFRGLMEQDVRLSGAEDGGRRRNRNFDQTHYLLIAKAVELIGDHGADALSISMLARHSGINRSTVYYHFESREALIEAVRAWSSERIAEGFRSVRGRDGEIDALVRFLLSNVEITKLWIDEFITPGKIADRVETWDGFVAGLDAGSAGTSAAGIGQAPIDAELAATILVVSTIIASRVYRHSVRPDLPLSEAIERLDVELDRLHRFYGVVRR